MCLRYKFAANDGLLPPMLKAFAQFTSSLHAARNTSLFFSLYVLEELSVAALNSSHVVPRIFDTLPHRARHDHHPPASSPGPRLYTY